MALSIIATRSDEHGAMFNRCLVDVEKDKENTENFLPFKVDTSRKPHFSDGIRQT